MPGAVTGCACVIGGIPGRGPTGGGIPTDHKESVMTHDQGRRSVPSEYSVASVLYNQCFSKEDIFLRQ